MTFRILIVDDFDGFRKILSARLKGMHQCEVIGEAADGMEAVEKARELRPDLVLLDVGLPSLNGVEVGRRIRALCPRSKVLYVSQDTSLEIVQAALRTGANGYLLKTDVADRR